MSATQRWELSYLVRKLNDVWEKHEEIADLERGLGADADAPAIRKEKLQRDIDQTIAVSGWTKDELREIWGAA